MAKKKQKRILFLGILSLVFLYPVIYMLVCSVWEGRNAGISLDTLNNLNYDTQQELVFEYMADSSDTARLYEITNKALSIAELDRVAKLINIPVDTLKEYPFETQVQLCGIYAMESDNVTEFELANRLRGAVGL